MEIILLHIKIPFIVSGQIPTLLYLLHNTWFYVYICLHYFFICYYRISWPRQLTKESVWFGLAVSELECIMQNKVIAVERAESSYPEPKVEGGERRRTFKINFWEVLGALTVPFWNVLNRVCVGSQTLGLFWKTTEPFWWELWTPVPSPWKLLSHIMSLELSASFCNCSVTHSYYNELCLASLPIGLYPQNLKSIKHKMSFFP